MKSCIKKLTGLLFFLLTYYVNMAQSNLIRKNNMYAFFADSIVQQNYIARALSSTEIISNYHTPVIQFRFSINGKDNEMRPRFKHQFYCSCETESHKTPVIKFGESSNDAPIIPPASCLKSNTKLTFRVDMGKVLAEIKNKGFYSTFQGDKIYKEDLKAVYVAGSIDPLIWDFDSLKNRPDLQLKDPDGDGVYEVTLTMKGHKYENIKDSHWKLSKDISAFPKYRSNYPLTDALYNMALEEMEKAVEPDSTFRTGKEWAGVWTRDISYSIILSMATLQPEVSKKSLLRKVKNGKIIQDTGTGGAYPVSSDRMVWAIAAWEIYKVTGDASWLQQAFGIIKNSLEDDQQNIYDRETGLARGESSFLDWREQTYPEWMQPADIFQSENLGTNAVHFQANIVLSNMAKLLNDLQAAEKYNRIAEKIKNGINKYLWQPERGYYGQYLYGRNSKTLSPRSEALGEALCVLFDIADFKKQRSIIENTPVTAFGIPCIYPQIPDIPPYHNNGIWPFVQSYWALASAKAGNEQAVIESISAIYRPAALFLTNQENFVAANGDLAGTRINSSNMLWSLSGNISLIYKILFGINYQADRLVLKPFVPAALKGKRSLTEFKYRNAMLDFEMEGYGNKIKSIALNGKILAKPEIMADLKGRHTVKIILENNDPGASKINRVANDFSPATPSTVLSSGQLTWLPVEKVKNYVILKNGKKIETITKTSFTINPDEYGQYQVIAIDPMGLESFAGEPQGSTQADAVHKYEVEKFVAAAGLPYQGFSGDGFAEISKTKNTKININVIIPQTGKYAIDFKYGNGNGPVNTDNKCAIRTLMNGSNFLGTVVFPQRGRSQWADWGYTNAVITRLEKGTHTISLTFEAANQNMDGDINQAMLDYMRLIKID